MAERHASGRLPPWEEPADRELADAAARARILTELDRNLVVEAAAGAGKTHALVGRIVALLASGRCTVDQVAAVTFTRKAAGELRGRLLTRIERSLERLEEAPAEHSKARENLRAAMDGFERAFAGTIHSFCARLLRERPVEAGVDPGFEEMDDRDAAALRREAWDRHVDRESEGPSARLERLEEAGIDPEDLFHTFERLCEYPEVDVPREAVPPPDLGEPARRLREFAEWALERVPDVPVEERHDAMQGTLFAARSFLRNRDLESPAVRAEFLKLFDGGTRVIQKLWGDSGLGKEVKETFDELASGVLEPALADWRAHCYPVVLDFVEPAVEEYGRLRQRRGVLSFQDLLLRTARLLRREPRVREYFVRRYPRILVDEFQDTDPLQAEILFLLTGTDRRETNWRRLEPRSGSLFLVGDPKQSIYRFRRADVDVYRYVRDRIAETGGEVVHLQTSFRSLRPLVEWLNGSLEPILEAHDRDVGPPFVPLAPYRRLDEGDGKRAGGGEEGHGPRVRRVVHGRISGNPVRDVAENDARAIARWIRAAVDGEAGDALPGDSLAPGEALVLLRQKKHLDLYARALEEVGLPYEVSGGGAVGDSEELELLLGMAEAALHPDDPVALAAYLRGPMVGLSDDALYRFRTAGGVWDYAAHVRRGRPLPDLPERDGFREAFEQLHEAYRWLNQLSPAAALEKIASETGVLAHAAGLDAGSSRAGSLYRALSLVRQWQARGREVAWILEELRTLAEGDGPEVDEMVLEAGRGDAVRVMNLHKAKGLQGRVVFLADPLTKIGGGVTSHVERVEGRGGKGGGRGAAGASPRGHFRVTRRNRYGGIADELARPAGWEEIEALEERYRAAEEARLLYVAATRARDLLVVSQYLHSNRDQPWAPFHPALEDVPELEPPPADAPPADPSPPAAPAAPDGAEIQARLARLCASSYEICQPSDVDPEEPGPVAGTSGEARDPDQALAYGHVVHEALRAMAEGGEAPDRERARQMLEAAGGDPEAAAGVVAATRRAREAWFWAELEAADRALAEVPFGRWLVGGRADDAAVAATDGARGNGGPEDGAPRPPSLERGAVDLAYRRADGWVIVDYKTHRVTDDADLDDLAERLEPQVEDYREAWEAISGEPVARAGLFFTRTGAWREVGGG